MFGLTWVQILLIVLLAIASGVFYRLGGASPSDFPKLPKWLIDGNTRDIGCTLCGLAMCFTIEKNAEWYRYAGFVAIGFWGLKSYFSWLNEWIEDIICNKCGYPFGKCNSCKVPRYFDNKHWWNWFLSGFVMSAKWLVIFPTPFTLMYALINAIAITLWRELNGDVDYEEFGTGVLFII